MRQRIFTYWHSPLLPPIIKACISTWRLNNPDCRIEIYDYQRAIGEISVPGDFDNWTKQLQADYVRLYLIEKYGGIWMDSSVIMTKSFDDDWLKHNKLIGFETPWCNDVMENWIFCANRNNAFIKKWRQEFSLAISMGLDKYRDEFMSDNKIPFDIRTKVNVYLPYLTMHACWVKIKYHNLDLDYLLKSSVTGPFFYLIKSDWDSHKACQLLCQLERSPSTLIKLRGAERDIMQQYLLSGSFKTKSIVGQHLGPLLNNLVIVRTHNPTDAMIDRIWQTDIKCYDRRIIIVLHLNLQHSFDIFENQDIFGYDLPNTNTINNFGNCQEFLNKGDLVKCIRQGKIAFVKYNNTYHIKQLTRHDDAMSIKVSSQGRTTYILKPNIIKLIETFSDLFIQTDWSVWRNIKRRNFPVTYKDPLTHKARTIAWNYHNEFIYFAAQKFLQYKPNYVWVLEDDLEYTGNIVKFMQRYERQSFDFLASDLEYVAIDSGDLIFKNMSPKALQLINQYSEIPKCREYIVCYSNRFLERIGQFSLDEYNGHSELMTPFLCRLWDMRYIDIDSKYYGPVFDWGTKFTPDKVKSLTQQLKSQSKSVFMHPCKF